MHGHIHLLDDYVTEHVIDRIETAGIAHTITLKRDDEIRQLKEIDDTEAAVRELDHDYYAERHMTRDQYMAVHQTLMMRLQGLRRDLGIGTLPRIRPTDIRQQWPLWAISRRRTIIAAVTEKITLRPAQHRRDIGSRVQIAWR